MVWEVFAFYFWVWVALLLNLGLIVSIACKLKAMAVVQTEVGITLKKLLWYPALLMSSWAAITVIDIYGLFHAGGMHELSGEADDAFTVNCILQGAVLSIVFFAKNSNVRSLWYHFLTTGERSLPASYSRQQNASVNSVAGSTNLAMSRISANMSVQSMRGSIRLSQMSSSYETTAEGAPTRDSVFEFADRPRDSSMDLGGAVGGRNTYDEEGAYRGSGGGEDEQQSVAGNPLLINSVPSNNIAISNSIRTGGGTNSSINGGSVV